MDASYGIASEKTRTTRRQVLKDKKKSLEQLQITMQQKMFLDVFRCIIITYWCILLRRLKSKKKKHVCSSVFGEDDFFHLALKFVCVCILCMFHPVSFRWLIIVMSFYWGISKMQYFWCQVIVLFPSHCWFCSSHQWIFEHWTVFCQERQINWFLTKLNQFR